jgi:endogenous inhibitor of DNA gyrase (YacG/DUF329 family)
MSRSIRCDFCGAEVAEWRARPFCFVRAWRLSLPRTYDKHSWAKHDPQPWEGDICPECADTVEKELHNLAVRLTEERADRERKK